MSDQHDSDKSYEAGGIALAGCLFIGLAIGMWQHHVTPYTIGGLGVGLLLMALFRLTGK